MNSLGVHRTTHVPRAHFPAQRHLFGEPHAERSALARFRNLGPGGDGMAPKASGLPRENAAQHIADLLGKARSGPKLEDVENATVELIRLVIGRDGDRNEKRVLLASLVNRFRENVIYQYAMNKAHGKSESARKAAQIKERRAYRKFFFAILSCRAALEALAEQAYPNLQPMDAYGGLNHEEKVRIDAIMLRISMEQGLPHKAAEAMAYKIMVYGPEAAIRFEITEPVREGERVTKKTRNLGDDNPGKVVEMLYRMFLGESSLVRLEERLPKFLTE